MMQKMKLNNEDAVQTLSNNILSYFSIQDYKDILQFVQQDIDLSEDISSQSDKIDFFKYPYMVQPLKNAVLEKGKRKEIVVVWGDQMGKTTLEYLSILFNCCYNTLQGIILYPSQQLAMQMNMVKFVPLFKKIKMFEQDLEKPFSIRSDRLKLSNAVLWFDGAGKKCVGKSSKLVLGDQCAMWECPNINNINELKKRTRSFDECLQIFCSTPTYKENPFWMQFLNSSMGFYTLRCAKCGKLTMRSADIHNLQFESFFDEQQKLYKVKKGTCRLVCPSCHFQHSEQYRKKIISQGAYVHRYEQKKDLCGGYQAGVLASMLNVHCWDNLADVQLASGKSASLQDYISWDNSYRALPLQDHTYNKQNETSLSQHKFKISELNIDDVEAIVVSADTQGTFSVYSVMALTRQNNYYVLECGRIRFLFLDDEQRQIINAENKRQNKQPQITLLDILNKQYYGIKPLCLLVDQGGNRSDEIKNFSKIQKNILMYKGTNLKFDTWRISENHPKLFLCDFKKSLADFIFMLHFQKNKETNYLFLPYDISDKDISELLSFQPDNTKRNGNLFENWTCQDKVHDMADTIRMGLMAFKIASKIYRKQRFIHGEARILNMNRNPLKKQVKKPQKPLKTVIRKPLFNRTY